MNKKITALLQASQLLCNKLNKIQFPKKIYTYNVFEYAWKGWEAYVSHYAITSHTQKYLLLGINPGPHGMVQTGIPFGNIATVKDYLTLNYTVHSPSKLHPKRPVKGLQYTREEKSGQRLWNCISTLFPNPLDFFNRGFVLNFCPLAFFDENGTNLTPDNKALRVNTCIQDTEELCKEHLHSYCNILHINSILAIGRYSYTMAYSLLASMQNIIPQSFLHYIPHPSPLNPKHKDFDKVITSIFTISE